MILRDGRLSFDVNATVMDNLAESQRLYFRIVAYVAETSPPTETESGISDNEADNGNQNTQKIALMATVASGFYGELLQQRRFLY